MPHSTINVVVFGESGVGKSSVINLIAQNEVAEVLSGSAAACTMQSTRYLIPFDGLNFAVFDTVAFDSPHFGSEANGFLEAFENAYELIVKLSAAGGVHLLLFCMKAGRITKAAMENYRLSVECLCNASKVPIALVITHCEMYHEMDDWWMKNKNDIEHCGLKNDGHVCITAYKGLHSVFQPQFNESQTKIRRLLKECTLKHASSPKTDSWLAQLSNGPKTLIGKSRNSKRRDIEKVLTRHCGLDHDIAKRTVDIMEKVDSKTMVVEDGVTARARVQDDTDIAPGDPETKDGQRTYGGEAAPKVSNNKSAEDCETGSSRKIAELEKTIGVLRNQITAVERAANAKEHSLMQIIHVHENMHECELLYIHGCIYDAVKLLVEITSDMSEDLRNNIFLIRRLSEFSDRCVSRLQTMGDEASTAGKHDEALSAYSAVLSLTPSPPNNVLMGWARWTSIRCSADEALCAATKFILPKFNVYRAICDVLEADDRVPEAVECFRRMQNELSEVMSAPKEQEEWVIDFRRRCTERLERLGDTAMDPRQVVSRVRMTGDIALSAQKYDETLSTYSALLSVTPSPSNAVVMGWARLALVCCSVDGALAVATKFVLPKFHVYRAICDILEGDNHVLEAISYFRRMETELSEGMSAPKERAEWEINFRRHCTEKLENIGDAAMDSRNHDEAIACYSNALSLNPTNTRIIVKCCRARTCFLEDELFNATKDIELNPSCYEGYKRKHAVLHSMGRYGEAFEAFEMMLSNLEQSPDPQICNLRSRYLDTTPLIREVIERTIRDIPRVLIDVTTGRLNDKALQAAAFEQLQIFNELRSSMITRDRLDYPRIQREVEMFYRYVMLSHKWQPDEPTFQKVENMSIYGLPDSPANKKLIKFCHLVDYRHFRWAWSDTYCVNQVDNRVQQESVIAMFRWYHGSSLTIVHLLGVLSESQEPDSLWKSIWNTRGWTYQEYVASKVVQFYTEDWKPYLNLKMFNHKESPVILSEMERATIFATQDLNKLQPGLDRVREKLYLASKRQTTREEDIAYSLFGIFNVAISVIYGEGKQAVGRFLEYILARSKNVTILAWTGTPGSHHSYLPSDLTVYDQIVPRHLPLAIAEIDTKIAALQLFWTSRDLSLATRLYEQLDQFSRLSLVAGQMRLSGLVFPLTNLIRVLEPGHDSNSSTPVYRATTPVLGDVLIQTADDLSMMKHLVLIHPWITPLLDADFSDDSLEFDLATRARRLVFRLRQPFGALLLTSRGREPYKRVATDSFIETQVRQEVTLEELVDSIRTVDIL